MGRWRSGAFILSINLIWSCIAILISFSCLSMFSYNSLSFYKQLLWILSQTILRPPFLKDHLVEINYFPFCVILLMFLLALHWCLCCGIITSLSLYGLASSRKDLHQSACLEILETFLWMYKCYITLLSSREIKGCIPFPSIRVMLATQLFPRQCTKRRVYWMHTQFFSLLSLRQVSGLSISSQYHRDMLAPESHPFFSPSSVHSNSGTLTGSSTSPSPHEEKLSRLYILQFCRAMPAAESCLPVCFVFLSPSFKTVVISSAFWMRLISNRSLWKCLGIWYTLHSFHSWRNWWLRGSLLVLSYAGLV